MILSHLSHPGFFFDLRLHDKPGYANAPGNPRLQVYFREDRSAWRMFFINMELHGMKHLYSPQNGTQPPQKKKNATCLKRMRLKLRTLLCCFHVPISFVLQPTLLSASCPETPKPQIPPTLPLNPYFHPSGIPIKIPFFLFITKEPSEPPGCVRNGRSAKKISCKHKSQAKKKNWFRMFRFGCWNLRWCHCSLSFQPVQKPAHFGMKSEVFFKAMCWCHCVSFDGISHIHIHWPRTMTTIWTTQKSNIVIHNLVVLAEVSIICAFWKICVADSGSQRSCQNRMEVCPPNPPMYIQIHIWMYT